MGDKINVKRGFKLLSDRVLWLPIQLIIRHRCSSLTAETCSTSLSCQAFCPKRSRTGSAASRDISILSPTSAMYGTAVHRNHQKPAQRFGTPALQAVKCRSDKFSPTAVHQNGKETVQRCYEEHGKPHLLRIIIKNFKKVCGIKKMCYLCNPNSKAVVVKW